MRTTAAAAPDSRSQVLSKALLRVGDILGFTRSTLRQWMNNTNKDLRGVPSELITTVTGLARVVAYVDAHRRARI